MLSLIFFSLGYYYAWIAQTHIPKLKYYENISVFFGVLFYVALAISIFSFMKYLGQKKREKSDENKLS
jgi:hypothetical protein